METVRVLLVEDDEFDAEVVHRALGAPRSFQYEVETAHTLAGAFQCVCHAAYDVILLDLGLPDGMELGGLSKLVQILNVPVIVLSGNEDEELAERAISSGAHDYVPKSENLSLILHRTIQFAIHRQRTQAALAKTEGMLSAQGEFAKFQAARIQEKLKFASRLASFAENTDQCVAILNADGHVEWTNQAFRDCCEPGFESLASAPLNVLSKPSDSGWLDAILEAVASIESCKVCWAQNDEDGITRWSRVELFPIPQLSTGMQRFYFSFVEETATTIEPVEHREASEINTAATAQ